MYFEISWQSALIQFIRRLEKLICAENYRVLFMLTSCRKNNRRQSALIWTKFWKKKSSSENSRS